MPIVAWCVWKCNLLTRFLAMLTDEQSARCVVCLLACRLLPRCSCGKRRAAFNHRPGTYQPRRLPSRNPRVTAVPPLQRDYSYPEIEGGYECCSPTPLTNSRNTSGWEFQTHTSIHGNSDTSNDKGKRRVPRVLSQTARDVVGADDTSGGVACTAVAFTASQAGSDGLGMFSLCSLKQCNLQSRLLPNVLPVQVCLCWWLCAGNAWWPRGAILVVGIPCWRTREHAEAIDLPGTSTPYATLICIKPCVLCSALRLLPGAGGDSAPPSVPTLSMEATPGGWSLATAALALRGEGT